MKTLKALVAAGVVAATAIAAAPAASAASAASATAELGCPHPRVANRDPGYVTMIGSFNLKAGPYQGSRCATITKVRKGTQLWVHCWVINSYGTPWGYMQIKGTRTWGWMSASNVDYGPGINFAKCPGAEL